MIPLEYAYLKDQASPPSSESEEDSQDSDSDSCKFLEPCVPVETSYMRTTALTEFRMRHKKHL